MSSEELLKAVRALVDDTKVRLFRDDEATGTWQHLPSLLAQLESSAQGTTSTGGTAKFASRPVISTGVVALIIEIEDAATRVAVDLVGCSRGNTADNLRAMGATLTDAEQIGYWTGRLVTWTGQARGKLGLDPQRTRSVRGVRCPDCGASTARLYQDGEWVRTPALIITWAGPGEDDLDYHEQSAWGVASVDCRRCGKCWVRGGPMHSLIGQMLDANQTVETLAI